MHHNILNSYRFEGPLGQLVWVSRAEDSSKMMEAAAAETDGRDQEPRKKFSGACFPTSHPIPQRPLLVLTLVYPPGPAPGFASGRSQCFSFPLSLKSLTFPT